MNKMLLRLLPAFLAIAVLTGCREDEVVMPAEYETIPDTPAPGTSLQGM